MLTFVLASSPRGTELEHFCPWRLKDLHEEHSRHVSPFLDSGILDRQLFSLEAFVDASTVISSRSFAVDK